MDTFTSSSSSVESLQSRLSSFQSKVEKMINRVTISSLPLQKNAFQCCVDCFSSDYTKLSDPQQHILNCIQNCQTKAESFSQTVQSELQMLQNNVQSCQQICFNRFSSMNNIGDDNNTKNQLLMEDCISKCLQQYEPHVDEIENRLQNLAKNIKN